jgi:hypothetical protein
MSIKPFFIISICTMSLFYFSGCTQWYTTEVTLISSTIVDDDGFASLSLSFNTSDKVEVSVFNPAGDTLYSDNFYKGEHQVTVHLSSYKKQAESGMYQIQAEDKDETIILQQDLLLSGANLTISHLDYDWWMKNGDYTLVGVQLVLQNHGDLAAYPHLVNITADNKNSSGFLLPSVILPHQNTTVKAYVHCSDIPSEEVPVTLKIKDFTGELLAVRDDVLTPTQTVTSLTYRWKYKGDNSLELPNVSFLYEYYTTKDRLILEDYASYIFDVYDDGFLEYAAETLLSSVTVLDDIESINYVLAFIQRLQYVYENSGNESCEYARYPLEMLVDQQGDCEDKAILTAALLYCLDYNITLLRLPNHMAVGVHLPKNISANNYFYEEYYFLETTRYGWTVGVVPPEYKEVTNITSYPISHRPLILHEWKNATRYTGTDGSDYVKLKIRCKNLGRDTAQMIQLKAGFYTSSGICLNQKTTTVSSLLPQYQDEIELRLDIPQNVTTSLKTQIYLENTFIQEKESAATFP